MFIFLIYWYIQHYTTTENTYLLFPLPSPLHTTLQVCNYHIYYVINLDEGGLKKILMFDEMGGGGYYEKINDLFFVKNEDMFYFFKQ